MNLNIQLIINFFLGNYFCSSTVKIEGLVEDRLRSDCLVMNISFKVFVNLFRKKQYNTKFAEELKAEVNDGNSSK